MNSIAIKVIVTVIFVAVWDLCDFLFVTMIEQTEFQFAFHDHLMQPIIACIVLMLLEQFFSKKE